MTFSYDRKSQTTVDLERGFSLKLTGGRPDQNNSLFRFSAHDCVFEVRVFYTEKGLRFEWPGGKDEFGRACSNLRYDNDAFIELSLSGFRLISGSCDHSTYNEELKEALASHYRYEDRFHGPIYLRHTGPYGAPVRSQINY